MRATPSCVEARSQFVQVMGMLQGKVMGDTFVVVDTFALPVEGTETRVNAAEGAYPYMISYLEAAKVCCTSTRSTLGGMHGMTQKYSVEETVSIPGTLAGVLRPMEQ
jgi:hypothetical protein